MVGRPGGPSARTATTWTVYGYMQVSVWLEYLLEIMKDELMSDKQFSLTVYFSWSTYEHFK